MRTVCRADLQNLPPFRPLVADTDDIRTPECFIRLETGDKLEVAGNNGSIQTIVGSARVQFDSGDFTILGRYGDVFHCRTPADCRVTATENCVVQVLGAIDYKTFAGDEIPRNQIQGARLIWTGTEAYYAVGDSFSVGEREMKVLRDSVAGSKRKRVRLCTHKNSQAMLHEMFVCYMKDTKIAPHKHLAKDESFHILEGELDFITYNATGDVTDIIPMGDYSSGKPFYVRVPRDTNHTVAMTSDFCILHEGTAGPFNREHTVWATF